MNYATAEVNSLMKVVVAEQTSTIFIFYVALLYSELRSTKLLSKDADKISPKLNIHNWTVIKPDSLSIALRGSTV